MTFNYTDALTSDQDKIRFRISDTQEDIGPRPDKRNFSNEEIAFVLSEETEVNASIAHCFEILASEWTSFSLSESGALASFNAKGTAKEYLDLASKWRKKPGGASDAERSASLITLEREDEYTD